MKTIYKSLLILFSGILLFSACSPDDPKLDTPIAKDKLSFEAYQDSENPNKVIIKSNNTSDIDYWSWDNTSGSAGGYTTNYSDTLKFGFAGKYTINYSIASNGGLVAAVKCASGKDPHSYSADASDPESTKIKSLKEETAKIMRSRILNPKWF